MQITEIKKIGKGQRYALKVDDVFEGVFESAILAKYNLKTGQEIDGDFLSALKQENGDYACFDRALNLLEHGSKCKKQIVDYLLGKGYPQNCVDSALEKLQSYGYIDDYAYACEYVRTYSGKDGERKMRYSLKNKGVTQEVIDAAMRDCLSPETALQTCLSLAQKKAKNADLDAKTRQKLFAYLAGRGFDFDTINHAINLLQEGL